jgi:hypothetical protein
MPRFAEQASALKIEYIGRQIGTSIATCDDPQASTTLATPPLQGAGISPHAVDEMFGKGAGIVERRGRARRRACWPETSPSTA